MAAVQVLSPMRRGPAGVQSLNARLQALLNPPQPGRAEISLAAASDRPQLLRVGDRVIQARSLVPCPKQHLSCAWPQCSSLPKICHLSIFS